MLTDTERTDRFDAIGSGDESDVIRTITLSSNDYFIPFSDRKPHFLATVDFTDSVGDKWKDSCVLYIRFLDQTGAAISNDDMHTLSTSEIKDKADSVVVWVSRNKHQNA